MNSELPQRHPNSHQPFPKRAPKEGPASEFSHASRPRTERSDARRRAGQPAREPNHGQGHGHGNFDNRQTRPRAHASFWGNEDSALSTFNPGLVAEFSVMTRYAPKRDALVRAAIANTLFSLEASAKWPQAKIWDAIGRWNAALRSEKVLDGITENHHGLQAIQRIRLALFRARNDPARMHLLRHPMHVFLSRSLKDLEVAVSSYLDRHPELYLSGEALAGMAPAPASGHYAHPIFKRPPSIAKDVTAQSSLPRPTDLKVDAKAPSDPNKSGADRGHTFWALLVTIHRLAKRAWAAAGSKVNRFVQRSN